ncbi:MAG TPA: ABC transporter permease [Candidatus Dormibacteraeota bacterium]
MIGQGAVAEAARLQAGVEDVTARPAQSYWRASWQRLVENRVGMAAGAVVLLMVVIALAAPLVAVLVHHQYYEQDLDNNFAPPFAPNHLLGTDELGRDTLVRLMYGAQVSLGVALLTVLLSLTVGSTVGVMAGYYGGLIEDLLMRLVDVVLAIPRIFLFILVGILFFHQTSLLSLSIVIASVGWGATARLCRGETLSLRSRDFMLATRSLGASDVRLMVRHLLPNVLPVLIVAASLGVGGIILAEAALDYLGFGIHPPTPSWGNMLSNAQTYYVHSVWLVILPGVCIFITVLAANVLGNAVRDAFDPRLR